MGRNKFYSRKEDPDRYIDDKYRQKAERNARGKTLYIQFKKFWKNENRVDAMNLLQASADSDYAPAQFKMANLLSVPPETYQPFYEVVQLFLLEGTSLVLIEKAVANGYIRAFTFYGFKLISGCEEDKREETD